MASGLPVPQRWAAVGVLGVLLAGCSAGAAPSADPARPAAGSPATAVPVPGSGQAAAAANAASVPIAPDSLAPAGPAPGGPVNEAEPGARTPVAQLADSIHCVDGESQAHLPFVSGQTSCRRGTERVYVLTFPSTADRDRYLTQGPQVVPGGWNVTGPQWLLHVESRATATELAQSLHGVVVPGA